MKSQGQTRLRTRLSSFQATAHAARAGAAAEEARRRAGSREGEDPHHKLLLGHPDQKGSMHHPRNAQALWLAGERRQGASMTPLLKVVLLSKVILTLFAFSPGACERQHKH